MYASAEAQRESAASAADTMLRSANPLFLEGWREFNRQKWGLYPVTATFAKEGAELPRIDTVLMVNKRGRVVHPPQNPYLALAFRTTPTQAPYRLYRQWLEVAQPLARDMRSRGVANLLALPPEVIDVRPWQWNGFRTEVRYTFMVSFPYDLQQTSHAVRGNVRKAMAAGFRPERTTNVGDFAGCLAQTEERHEWDARLKREDLELVRSLLGDEHFRIYICYSPSGEAVSGRVVLQSPGTTALVWLAGTKISFLSSGASELLLHHMFTDMQASGVNRMDFVGANLAGVAAAKANWGATLVPYYVVETPGLAGLLRNVRTWWKSRSEECGPRAAMAI